MQQVAFDFTQPTVHCTGKPVECVGADGSSDTLLVFEIEASEQVHATNKDEVFLRVGDENRKLNFDQRRDLLYDKGQAFYEITPVSEAAFDDFDLTGLNRTPRRSDMPTCTGCCKPVPAHQSREVTTAAILLFGANPQVWLPEAYVRVLRYQGPRGEQAHVRNCSTTYGSKVRSRCKSGMLVRRSSTLCLLVELSSAVDDSSGSHSSPKTPGWKVW